MFRKFVVTAFVVACVGVTVGFAANKLTSEVSLLRTIISLTEQNENLLAEIAGRDALLRSMEEQEGLLKASLNQSVQLCATMQEEIDELHKQQDILIMTIRRKEQEIADLLNTIDTLKKVIEGGADVPNPDNPVPVPTPGPTPNGPNNP
jgi:hypothetical protein